MKKLALFAAACASLAAASPAFADGGLTFVIDGDTFDQPFTITNTSTAGETVTGFGITLAATYGFDTVNGGYGIDAANPFAPQGGTGVSTGYTGPGSFADGATSIAFTFNSFGVGQSFIWVIDVDHDSIAATVIGNELIGSTGYADFSNGLRGNGTFVAFGDNGSQFQINTFTPTPGVPEPATWGLMIAGFGLAGASLRSRRRMIAA